MYNWRSDKNVGSIILNNFVQQSIYLESCGNYFNIYLLLDVFTFNHSYHLLGYNFTFLQPNLFEQK